MRVLLALWALFLVGCIEVPEQAQQPSIVYEETLSLASASDDRQVPFDVPAGFTSLTVFVSGRNSADTGSNARVELFDPEGRGGGDCECGGGSAPAESSFGSGGRPRGADGTWTLDIDAYAKSAIHVRVRANPTGGG